MKKRIVAGAVVAALSLVAVGVQAAPAFATGPGTLLVQVVTPAKTPLEVSNLFVSVYDAPSSASHYSESLVTNGSGNATFSDVPAGVKLKVDVSAQEDYLGNLTTGIKVTAGQTRTLNIVDALGGSISGTVTEGSSSTGLADADVILLNSQGVVVRVGTTDGSGDYEISGVKSGSYRLQFNSRLEDPDTTAVQNYSWSYWDGFGTTSTNVWTSAKSLTFKQQGAHNNALGYIGVNGEAFLSETLTGTVSYWSPESSHAGQLVRFVAKHAADDFYTELGSNGNISEHVNPGEYKIEIQGDFDPIFGEYPSYWYVSDTKGPTASESKATWVKVSTAPKSILFIQQPLAG